jgi:hypothetical protein
MGAGLAAPAVHAPCHRVAARGCGAGLVPTRGVEEARKAYVQGCLKLLERGERLPNRVLLLLADELGWGVDDG